MTSLVIKSSYGIIALLGGVLMAPFWPLYYGFKTARQHYQIHESISESMSAFLFNTLVVGLVSAPFIPVLFAHFAWSEEEFPWSWF